jgi:hypothetical protein
VDDRGAIVGGADVSDIGLAEFVGPETGQQCCEKDREITFSPISLALRVSVLSDGFEQRLGGGAGKGLGEGPG